MDPVSGLMTENVGTIATKIMTTAKSFMDAYENVTGACESLIDKMKTVQSMSENIRNCTGMPGDIALCQLYVKLDESTKAIITFTNKEKDVKNSTSVMEMSTFKLKRFFIYAPEFRDKFKSLEEALDELPKELKRIRELSEVLLKPNSLAYKDKFVNLESRRFWIEIAGTDIGQGEQSWSRFQTHYKNENPDSTTWHDNDWERIRRLACTFGNDLTLFGFIFLTKQAGYPIDIDKVPGILDSRSSMNEASRIEIAKMIKDLIKDFSSEEMNGHIVNIIKWYGSFENDQVRQEGKPYQQCTDREKMAQDVEKARRAIVYFYQQFLVICEFGRLSRDIFEKVDFPGKSRMRSFIGDCRPLDYANYCIIIKSGEEVNAKEWIQKQPKVYSFLEEFLNQTLTIEEMKKDNIKKREIELDARETNLQREREEFRKEKEKLEELKEELRHRMDDLKEKEDTYVKNVADLKAKEIISRFRNGVFSSKKKEDKQPKPTNDLFKKNNKVDSSTSKKQHDD
ncbi:unnamed protein product [Cunninghamella blakesleeana]